MAGGFYPTGHGRSARASCQKVSELALKAACRDFLSSKNLPMIGYLPPLLLYLIEKNRLDN
jgi:hypothetical protein